jgi:tetratricopeptide (TPR) repeat protein
MFHQTLPEHVMPQLGVRIDQRVDATSGLDSARASWHRGDFTSCLRALDAVRFPRRSADRAEALLLRGRALLRLDRVDEAATIFSTLDAFHGADERCTARMLYGSAVARSDGQLDRGIAILDNVARDAERLNVHFAIRAEIEYYRALAFWSKRDYDSALRHARAAERAGADIISARAAAVRGWVANANGAYREALSLFQAALGAYGRCQERDVHLAALLVQTISYIELDLFSKKSKSPHRIPSERDLPGAPFDLDVAPIPRLQAATHEAWLYALAGDGFNAYRRGREAIRLAPSDGWRVYALAESSAIADAFGEAISARADAAAAMDLADTVDWEATHHQERIGLLTLAGVTARYDPLRAGRTLDRYNALSSGMDALLEMNGDVRLAAYRDMAAGRVARSQGKLAEARDFLVRAYHTYHDLGFIWRAALALIELDAAGVSRSPDGRGEACLELAASIVRMHFPHSILAKRLSFWMDAVYAALPESQRQVLHDVLRGVSTRDIAKGLGLQYNTVRNRVGFLLKAFKVRTTPALIAECSRRGIA